MHAELRVFRICLRASTLALSAVGSLQSGLTSHHRAPTPTRKKATLIYRRSKNIRAVQLLLGHTKLESTVRYLGIEVDEALEIAEQTEA